MEFLKVAFLITGTLYFIQELTMFAIFMLTPHNHNHK